MTEPRATGAGRLLAALAWTVLLVPAWLWGRALTEQPAATVSPPGAAFAARHPHAAAGRPGGALALPRAHTPLPRARPRALAIASLRLRAPVEPRGLDASGAVDPPPYDRPGTVAWYRNGPAPGSPGAAVLVGHLDTRHAPAVFHGLGRLRPGATVQVAREDGSTAEFTVEDVTLHTKDHFDAAKVYGPRDRSRAELRLITCGGRYDPRHRTYDANVVVSAYLTGTTTADGTGRA
ncbi:class F sortase [Streptomyces mashuensis]|uniref:Class F sortase n=1 Tax=Streptomyces mashuensis TaxID=33904 RepID=A0A919B0L5_9ACTN|nr:class F sortase [Streptomyces mashuensis]GHF36599.1 class F sortase [Streptomyces mashuensis]